MEKKKEFAKRDCFEVKDTDSDNMIQGDDSSYNCNDESDYEKKNDDFIAEKILDWPVDAYSTLYIDGNNMLFLNSTLRQNTLRRKKKEK